MKSRLLALWVLAVLLFAGTIARTSRAAPEAHILRIDPRAGLADGQPVLTTIMELVQFTPMSEVVTNAGCGAVRGDALLDCISNAVSTKGALWKSMPFPEGNTRLLVRVEGAENPAKFVSKTAWATATKEQGIGTAWLIALDASSAMGPRYEDARQVANQFIGTMGPNDLAKLIIFDDRMNTYVANSAWTPAAQKQKLVDILTAHPKNSPSSGAGRPLGAQVKALTKAFGDLGNAGSIQSLPVMQAMVLLSNGAGRNDAGSAAVGAEVMKQFFLKGRFPEENTAAPKTPLPVISIYFPNARGFQNDLYAANDMQFMQDLSTPEVGGYFDIVKTGQGVAKSQTILSAVKSRFNQFWITKWRLSCISPTVEQSFRLIVQNTSPPVMPDATFKDVPIGIDPTQWPLDINVAQTKAEADANPLYPGGTFRVYGDFCWGGDKQRASAYFVPAGTKPDSNVNRNDPDVAKKAMASLIAQNMRGSALEAADTFVMLQVPDEEKVLEGQGENMVTRLVIYDDKAKRASGATAETVLTLKAQTKPFNLPLILGGAGILVVILLLVVVLMRGGGGGGGKGKKGRKGQQPPPAPVVAGGAPPYGGGGYGGPPGGGYGAPPGGGYGGGYGGPQGGGGYGASASVSPVAMGAAPAFVPHATPAPVPPPPDEGGRRPLASAGSAPVVQVRCPACGMLTMTTPGQGAVCFSCGQPLPRGVEPVSGPASPVPGAPPFPLTGATASRAALEPPPNPYAKEKTGATILGAAGSFAIRSGIEVRVGRDPAACPITLTEPRVSGVHATLKFEAATLYARDEGSNNGTFVDGVRLPSAVFTNVPDGGKLRFGPVEFSVRFD